MHRDVLSDRGIDGLNAHERAKVNAQLAQLDDAGAASAEF